jgi:hypothetical protein
MCGRIVQATSPEEIARELGADLGVALRESLSTPAPGDTSLIRGGWYPRWNMAPSSRALVIALYTGERGEGRQPGCGSWGLILHGRVVFAFRRYEVSSFRYEGIESHEELSHYGLHRTVAARDEMQFSGGG